MGYTPDLVVGAWVGNADNKPMQKVAGSLGAAPIWHNVMARALEGQPAQPFTLPQGINRSAVCADSGTLPGEACPQQREELFAAERGPLPAAYDLWQRVRVDRLTGLLASEFTPADRVETRDVAIFPERYREWAAAHGFPVLNAQSPYPFPPELALDSPIDGGEVTGVVPIAGRSPHPGAAWSGGWSTVWALRPSAGVSFPARIRLTPTIRQRLVASLPASWADGTWQLRRLNTT